MEPAALSSLSRIAASTSVSTPVVRCSEASALQSSASLTMMPFGHAHDIVLQDRLVVGVDSLHAVGHQAGVADCRQGAGCDAAANLSMRASKVRDILIVSEVQNLACCNIQEDAPAPMAISPERDKLRNVHS